MARLPQTYSVQGSNPVASPRAVALAPLPLEQTDDPQTNKLQHNLAQAAAPSALPFSNGNQFRDIAFKAAAPVTLSHGLNAAPRFAIMNTSGYARFKRSALSDSNLDKRMIAIVADADCVADVWVYA